MSNRFQLSRTDVQKWFIHVLQFSATGLIYILTQIQNWAEIDSKLIMVGVTYLAIDLLRRFVTTQDLPPTQP